MTEHTHRGMKALQVKANYEFKQDPQGILVGDEEAMEMIKWFVRDGIQWN